MDAREQRDADPKVARTGQDVRLQGEQRPAVRGAGGGQAKRAGTPHGYGVSSAPTQKCPVLARRDLEQLLNQKDFGGWLMGELWCCLRVSAQSPRAKFFDLVAQIARTRTQVQRSPSVKSELWWADGFDWLAHPADLRPLIERPTLECLADVYHYEAMPAGTLVVDFAARVIGGGCFGRGFVQEEQMVLQSTDFAIRVKQDRETLDENSAVSYEGVHIDAWWPREEASKQESAFDYGAIEPCHSVACTVFAVDAPNMKSRTQGSYTRRGLYDFAKKVLLIFEAARASKSPLVLTGLLGGGAFRNNRPLVLLLHMMMMRPGEEMTVRFHHPVFHSYNSQASTSDLEQDILVQADALAARLRESGGAVATLGEALEVVYGWRLPLSHNDGDLAVPGPSAYDAGQASSAEAAAAPTASPAQQVEQPPRGATPPSPDLEAQFLARLRVVPYGVLGLQLTTRKQEVQMAPEPDVVTAFVDAAGMHHIRGQGPQGSGGSAGAIYKYLGIHRDKAFPVNVSEGIVQEGDAKLHSYGDRHVIHAVGPDLRKPRYACAGGEAEASRALSQAYRSVFLELVASTLPLRRLRLLPLSSGIFSGGYSAQMPGLTVAALQRGFAMLDEGQQSRILACERLDLCIFSEAQFPAYRDGLGMVQESRPGAAPRRGSSSMQRE